MVVSLPVHVSESGDEGLGSMSPEPLSVITVSADGHASVAPSGEVAELKRQLERERVSRAHLEKQMRSLQSQLFPERFREEQLIAYQHHEVRPPLLSIVLSGSFGFDEVSFVVNISYIYISRAGFLKSNGPGAIFLCVAP